MQGYDPYYAVARETMQNNQQEADDTFSEALKTLLAAWQSRNNRLFSETLSDVVKLWLAMQDGNKALSREQTLDYILTNIKSRKQAKIRSYYGGKSK